MIDLKSCPFCGGPAHAFGMPLGKIPEGCVPTAIGCPTCQFLVGDTKGEDGNCIRRWNRRALPRIELQGPDVDFG